MSREQVRISVSAEQRSRILRLGGVVGTDKAREFDRVARELFDSERGIRIDWSEMSPMHACLPQIVLTPSAGVSEAGRPLILGQPSPEVAIYLRTAGFGSLLDGVVSQ